MALPFFVTPLYAALCGLLLMVLSARVILLRRALKVGLGDGDQPVLRRAIRVQANCAEYVPLALILLLLLEISHQVPVVALHVLGLLLLVGRIAHALGVSRSGGTGLGRIIGIGGTFSMMIVAAVWLLVIALAALRV
ncbi:MAPEG family protein [Ferrovibrio xuzhouensis]|uniref:MAPEG family protein n=1 Tax=Ferrovibrio xuzhouensis TaxID=1576914 RepID=A0ABV7VEF3_9PROT